MRLYIAGMYTNGTADREGKLFNELMNDTERAIVQRVPFLLESYHYVKSEQRSGVMRRDKAKVFLDSGAFSAFTLGKEIDLPAYCQFIREFGDIVDVASVLDGIGDPLKTWQNQVAMEQQGTRPLPCFHFGEDERYLEHYVANYEYITLGGMVPHSTAENCQWLDRIWSKYLCDKSGKPKLKVHGFGMTSVPLMRRYPWWSVDSSSWVQIAFRGGVMLPEYGRPVQVSSISPSRKTAGQHADTLVEMAKDKIVQAVERRGFYYERLRTVYISRWVFNLLAFMEIMDDINSRSTDFKTEQISLF